MASENSAKVSTKLNQKVLMQAWAQLSVYDQTATGLKNKFVQQRNWVIGLTLTATIASVLAGVFELQAIAVLLALVSLVLPIIAAILMNDLIKFTGKTAWIKYRYMAEMMRMHIYLYRTQAGDYAAGPIEKMDTLLSNNLDTLIQESRSDEAIPLKGQEPTDPQQIIKVINDATAFTSGDDGLSEIAVEDYIRWRIDDQRNWYKSKIDTDFSRLKFFARSGQLLLGLGALVGAVAGVSVDVRLIALIAITNTIAVALSQWSEVSMVGKTHSIFQIAWNQLGSLKMFWNSIDDDAENQAPAKRAEEFQKFAQRVENVLLWERQEWYEMALQTEAASDKAILGDLTKLNERAQNAQKQV